MALLHRDVRVILEGLDRRNNFIGSILPADVNDTSFVNVGEELCRLGLAQVHEASAAALIGGAATLRAAEKIGQGSAVATLAWIRPATVFLERDDDESLRCQSSGSHQR